MTKVTYYYIYYHSAIVIEEQFLYMIIFYISMYIIGMNFILFINMFL